MQLKHSFKTLFCTFFFVGLTQSSCKKDNDPRLVSYGSYKAGAKVNGKDFIAEGDLLNPPIVTQVLRVNDFGKRAFFLRIYSKDKSSIELYVDDFKGEGTYSLNNVTPGYPAASAPPSCGMYYSSQENNFTQYLTNTIDTGSVTFIEYRGGRTKCSFFYRAKNPRDMRVIEIAKGYLSDN